MSIRFERKPAMCTHINREVTLLIEFSTPDGLEDTADLIWEQKGIECLLRKSCKEKCPGEDKVISSL